MDILIDRISEMSLYGSIAILLVLLFRFAFKKMPKRITCLFWSVAALRLLCPINPGMGFSIMNLFSHKQKTAPVTISGTVYNTPEIANKAAVTITPTPVKDQAVITHPAAEKISRAAVTLDPKTILFAVWLAVCITLLIIFIVQAVKLHKALKDSKAQPDGSFATNVSSTAFVSGIVIPKIYIPETMSEDEKRYVLLHEKTHIKYHDHLTKIIGLIAVCIHWFNPLVWLAYILFSRDIEMRVDETVIDELGEDMKKDYCLSLVRHAKMPVVYKVLNTAFAGRSFGGSEVKMRIRNLIDNKNSNRKACALALITAIGATALFSSCADSEQITSANETTTAISETTASKASEPEESSAEETFEEEESAELRPFDIYDMVLGIRSMQLDPDSEYVDDFGDIQDGVTWDDLAPEALISADDIDDEELRAVAAEYEANGQEFYDINTINSELGGTSINNGYITVGEINGISTVTAVYKINDNSGVTFCLMDMVNNASDYWGEPVNFEFITESEGNTPGSVFAMSSISGEPVLTSSYNEDTDVCIVTLTRNP